MANKSLRRAENSEGDFFIDSTCIDCGTCYWMLPEVFREKGAQSSVYSQPSSDAQRERAREAIVACPVGSIGGPGAARAARSFPKVLEDNVFHCGYHSEKSFGAASWFIKRPEGNILIDSPRFSGPLIKELERMGGVKTMLFTHRDDVADHQKFREHFQCERMIHRWDASPSLAMEKFFEGSDVISFGSDMKVIPVPGHTRGHVVFQYKEKFLFTGDHLAFSSDLNHLYAFRNACWYSWSEQVRSMEKLRNISFVWVLPGHDAPLNCPAGEMAAQIEKCIVWMKKV